MEISKLDPNRIDAHRRDQAERGFPLLRACPNTSAMRLVRNLDRLGQAELMALFDQWAEYDRLCQTDAATPAAQMERLARFPVLAAFRKSTADLLSEKSVSTLPVKTVAGALNDPQIGGRAAAWARFLQLPPEAAEFTTPHARHVDDLVPVKPRHLRVALKRGMEGRFAATEERLSTDTTRYIGRLRAWKIAVDIEFVSNRGWRRHHQFRYEIWLGPKGGGRLHVPGYEALWSVPAEWDYVTVENLERSVAALCDVVECTRELGSVADTGEILR
ncbi:MAG: hypothetical protein AAGF88_09495 [Pseudomonadota bacterium]